MGIYDKIRSIPRRELLGVLRKSSGRIPETGGKRYSRLEREKIMRETFRSKYGHSISKDDYRRAVRGLEETKRGTKNGTERRKLDERIRFLKKIGE